MFLVLKICDFGGPNWYLLFQFFYSTLTTCIYHYMMQSPVQSQHLFCLFHIGIGSVIHLPALRGPFSLRNLPHDHLQPLSLLLADRTVSAGSLSLFKRKTPDSVLCIAAVPKCPLISWTQVATSGKYTTISTC